MENITSERLAEVLDLTLCSPEDTTKLLQVFIDQCVDLPPNGSKKVKCGSILVTIWKDGEWIDMFDVILSRNGRFREEDDHFGIHLDDLDFFVVRLLNESVPNATNISYESTDDGQ